MANEPDPARPRLSARAVVLVPGFQRAERFHRRDALVRGLCAIEGPRLRAGDEVTVGGDVGIRLESQSGADPQEVHVFEAYWADMFTEVATPSPWSRLVQGLGLIVYWMNFRMVRALRISRYMTFGLVGGGLVLVLWYVSTFVLAAQAIGADKTLSPDGTPKWLLDAIVAAGSWIGGWQLWATVTVLLPFLRADDVARLAAFARRYLENRTGEAESGLRVRVRQRVEASIERILDHGYSEVVVVAHSFGTIVATDLFADREPRPGDPRILLVTWGSPAAVMQCRSKWLRREIQTFAESRTVSRWEDMSSASDWLCAAHPARKASKVAGKGHKLDFEAGWLQRLTGQTHLEYYAHPAALLPLVQPVGAA